MVNIKFVKIENVIQVKMFFLQHNLKEEKIWLQRKDIKFAPHSTSDNSTPLISGTHNTAVH